MISKRIILTGGGTAGHVWPLIIVAEQLRRFFPSKFLYIGSQQGIEKMLIKPFYEYHAISVGKWRRYRSVQNIFDAIRLYRGIRQSRHEIAQFKPNLIFAKGGYVSLPVIMAAKAMKVPIVIHESDIVMGKTNEYAAKLAKIIFTGFPIECYPIKYHGKMVYSGNPVRPEFLRVHHHGLTIGKVTLKDSLPIGLVIGGSQGAQSINSMILDALPKLLPKLQLIHLTGPNDYMRCLNWKSRLPEEYFNQYHPLSFVGQELASFMAKATVIISRAGANTLAEISSVGRPAIIIPLPSAAGNHQLENAKWYADKRAVHLLTEQGLTSNRLARVVLALIGDRGKQKRLAQSIKALFRKNSTQIMTDKIASQLRNI